MKIIELKRTLPHGYGGRPMDIGSFTYDENGKSGCFIGYDHERGVKVVVPTDYFENLCINNQHYEVEIKYRPRKERTDIVGGLIKRLIPDSLKESITEDYERRKEYAI